MGGLFFEIEAVRTASRPRFAQAIHQGGADAPRSYGVAVDAWSLGAVVNVTLVARFPEFERSSAKSRV